MYNMLRVTIFSILCLAIAMAATTTTTTKRPHTHPTWEPTEHDTFKFVYEPRNHLMLVINSNTCYMFTLTDAERVSVHSDTGIAALEMKFLSSLGTATLTAPTEDQMDKFLRHACGGHINTYYVATI
ncbi:hypothetical protein ACF0H5_004700 [Mactra antiquata]